MFQTITLNIVCDVLLYITQLFIESYKHQNKWFETKIFCHLFIITYNEVRLGGRGILETLRPFVYINFTHPFFKTKHLYQFWIIIKAYVMFNRET